MGWESGTGLGKFNQGICNVLQFRTSMFFIYIFYSYNVSTLTGRKDPVPFELKDDHMGLGRWALEVQIPHLPDNTH